MEDRQSLGARIAELEARVAALEGAPAPPAGSPTVTPSVRERGGLSAEESERLSADESTAVRTGSDSETFWALEGLAARAGRPAGAGAVMIVGDVDTPGGDAARWQYALGVDQLFALDWSELAEPLAALGHPLRLAILRAVLTGARTPRELADAVDMGSTGQVYHHLKQLQAAGWLRTRHGGTQVVPAERLVPLLTTILGVLR